MQWASTVSSEPDTGSALQECCDAISSQLGQLEPDLVVVFASSHHDLSHIPAFPTTQGRFPKAQLFGCSGSGIIGASQEIEASPALSLTAAVLPGVQITPFHITSENLPSPDAPPDAWATAIGVSLLADADFLLLADPMSTNGEALLAGLDFAYPSARKVGGLVSGASPRRHAMFLGSETHREGAIGLALSGDIIVDTVVAQGCRPIGQPMRITGAEHNVLTTVDEMPTLDALQALYQTLDKRDRGLMERNLFIGLSMDSIPYEQGVPPFLIRNLIGVDHERSSIAIGALLQEGQIIQFHVRDAETSAGDLREALEDYARAPGSKQASGALLFSCTGRGEYLYGEANHDSRLFSSLAAGVPLGGFFCNGEIGPVGGITYLHGYTSSFAIFRPKSH